MKANIFNLNLVSPVFVIPAADNEPFAFKTDDSEKVFCFELDEEERLSFQPDRGRLFGKLIFGGDAVSGEKAGAGSVEGKAEIPAGNYLFAQKKEILSKEEIIGMAMEIQAEALWQRMKPGKNLYLRYLFEDGNWVTQLFRPYK